MEEAVAVNFNVIPINELINVMVEFVVPINGILDVDISAIQFSGR